MDQRGIVHDTEITPAALQSVPELSGNPPLIGVSSSEIRIPEHLKHKIREGEPPHREISLGLPYLNSIQQVGAVPVIFAPLQQTTIDRLLDAVDGICLSGGPDLDPKTYGQSPHPQLGPHEFAVDSFEIALARAADQRGMPILAICRGSQVLNVARGGTLFQHIPEQPGASLEHRQHQLGHFTTHQVEVAPDTLLSATLAASHGTDGSTTQAYSVNSFHHQSVDRLGANLQISAKSEDGIIEAIEATDRDYVLGVQWHAESLTDSPSQEALFRGLSEAAARYRQGSERSSTDSRRVRAV